MVLQDHFRPPLSERRHWHSFHHAWCTYISSHLNQQLPPGYFAEANVQYGIEIDVATLEESGVAGTNFRSAWTAPAPSLTLPISINTDIVEIRVFDREGGPTLAGAVELVSPANKNRPSHRDAFVSRCAAYLQQGVGLIVVDVVTDRHGNLHEEIVARLNHDADGMLDSDLYAAAYRPIERDGEPKLDIWQEPLALGRTFPTLPLWLRGQICIPVDLQATYDRTCNEQRIPVAGA